MPVVYCLAGIEPQDIAVLAAALEGTGQQGVTLRTQLGVAELAKAAPDVLVMDLDALEVDPLERLRQVRFVLPNCMVAVYTSTTTLAWVRACHLAGANCLLSKSSSKVELVIGLRNAIRGGCFTDPRFAA